MKRKCQLIKNVMISWINVHMNEGVKTSLIWRGLDFLRNFKRQHVQRCDMQTTENSVNSKLSISTMTSSHIPITHHPFKQLLFKIITKAQHSKWAFKLQQHQKLHYIDPTKRLTALKKQQNESQQRRWSHRSLVDNLHNIRPRPFEYINRWLYSFSV